MYPVKIYASMVSNLTDARYFAAMGVDIIGFDLDSNIEQNTIATIISWVEGPTFVGETASFSLSDEELVNYKETGLTTLLLSPFLKDQNNLPSSMTKYDENFTGKMTDPCVLKIGKKYENLTETEVENLFFKIEGLKCYLDIDVEPSNLKRLIHEINPHGLVIRGGEEERVGVKTFDFLDDFFDALEVI